MAEIKWTTEQLDAINEKGSNILVAAAAGSGKTAVLVERIIHKIIDEKIDIDKMLIVTFTNAAASEMREKILDAIYKKLEDEPQNIHLKRQINLLNKASICTIHSFCLDVIHNHFYEIDISSNFRIADTAEIDLLKQDVLDDLFEQKYLNSDADFLHLLETYTKYSGDEELQNLVLNIYKFIQSSPRPEKWIKDKLKTLEIPENIIDFSQTIWGESILNNIKEIIEDGIKQLEKLIDKMKLFEELKKYTQIISEDYINLKTIGEQELTWDKACELFASIDHTNWPRSSKITNELKDEAKMIRDNIKDTIKNKVTPLLSKKSEDIIKNINDTIPTIQKLSNLVLEFSKLFSEKKKEKNCIDFNDIEHFALKILLDENNEPTEIAKKYQNKFTEIAIDEYQDSNLVQEEILTSVSKGNNIFMVGDVKQSIYKFRQARPELFLEKYNTYKIKEEKSNGESLKIKLFRNFRSRENVLNITNLVFEAIMTSELGNIEYNEDEYLNYSANYPEPEEKINFAGIAELNVIDLKQNDTITAFKTDDEDEEETEEEEEERIEDDILEARYVANKIKELLNSDYQVFDKKQGYRKIKPKDIVILLRTISTLAPIYEKELSDLNLPVFSDSSGSYLDSAEIQTILSVLKIIDNPLQDIPIVVVLRSSIGNFTDNDLINIRLIDRNCNFYEALIKARLSTEGELKEKIDTFLSKIEKWQKDEKYIPLDELIWQIYLETGYYNYVGLLPNGAMRQANLKTLFEKAKQYEKASFKGLFNFIQFIDKLKKQNGDLMSAKLIGENEDVIRIMSIHKSKGLEFPVVFLGNIHKKFNLKDLNDVILLHQDLGFGPTFIDNEKKIKNSTIIKEAIKLKMKQEILSEEERILYVALTRAREKLYITGRSKNIEKDMKNKIQQLSNCKGENKIDVRIAKKANSYLDWLLQVYIFNKDKTIRLKEKQYNLDEIINLKILNRDEVLNTFNKQQNEEKKNFRDMVREKTENLEEIIPQKELEDLLNWKYEHIVDTKLQAKTSVTKIKESLQKIDEIEEDEEISKQNKKDDNRYIPKFFKKYTKISSAQKGTLVHLCIQKLDETKEYTLEDIKKLTNDLVIKKIITEEEKDAIDINLIYKYTKSQLFKELKHAKFISKEQPFYINIPAKEIIKEAKDANSDKNILVQGIIDLYYIDQNDKLILIDFKTDYISNKLNAEEEIKEKYKVQLEIYKRALEQALGRKVDKAEIFLINK